MLPKLCFYSLRGVNIFDQLCFEEMLLRNTTHNYFVFNHGNTEKSVVMGYSGKPNLLVNMDAAKRDKIRVLRRYTGGGTVIVDHSTMFGSIICNSKEVKCKPYPREIMQWSETVYGPVFKATADQTSNFRLIDHDYAFGNKKIGGNAQSIIKDRWVHHTSFLWDFEDENMAYLQIPSKRPEYRKDRGHLDFITPMKPHVSSVEAVEQALVYELQNSFHITQEDILTNEHYKLDYEELRKQHPDFVPRTIVEDLTQYS